MIGFISGEVVEITHESIVVQNQDLGFILFMHMRDLSELELAQQIKVFTEMIVREDDISLYGFLSPLDKRLFNKLRSVSGIGNKTAQSILGTFSAKEIIQLVIEDNQTFLIQVPGIGKKTAGRIILELKDPFLKEFGQQDIEPRPVESDAHGPKKDEVQLALLQLGYSKSEVSSFFKRADWDLSIEELIREALRSLARW